MSDPTRTTPDLEGIRGVLSRATGNGWEATYRHDVGALLCALDEARKDVLLAAGELMVPIPAPGTVEARLLLANVAMRRERDAARATLALYEARDILPDLTPG